VISDDLGERVFVCVYVTWLTRQPHTKKIVNHHYHQTRQRISVYFYIFFTISKTSAIGALLFDAKSVYGKSFDEKSKLIESKPNFIRHVSY
jgi:hypothetical protein